jgi:hypothetical protein
MTVATTMENERRSVARTQWAAQFAVASELCKRGYEVAFTNGNTTPLADLMVVSPRSKEMFLIDVKGQYKRNGWPVNPKTRPNLFYVFAFVPDNARNRFFVLSSTEASESREAERKRLGRDDPAHPSHHMTGIPWSQIEQHEDAWHKLPA